MYERKALRVTYGTMERLRMLRLELVENNEMTRLCHTVGNLVQTTGTDVGKARQPCVMIVFLVLAMFGQARLFYTSHKAG